MGLTQAMRENLPVAVPVEPDPDWPASAEAAHRWRINDLVTTPAPPWQYALRLTFPTGKGGGRRRKG